MPLNKSISLPSWEVTRSTALIKMAPSMLSISLRAGCVQNSRWALRFRTLSRQRFRMAVYMWGRLKVWLRWPLLNLLVPHENPSVFVGNQPNGIDRGEALSPRHISSPQGDRNGPHPAPHRPPPYYDPPGVTLLSSSSCHP